MAAYVIDTVEQLAPLGIGFILSMEALIGAVSTEKEEKKDSKKWIKQIIKYTILFIFVYIAALLVLSPLMYIIESHIVGGSMKKLYKHIYPIIAFAVSILSIIWLGTGCLSSKMFAGLGEAIFTLWIIIPLMAISGAIYLGDRNFSRNYRIAYSILMSITYISAFFIMENIESIFDGEGVVYNPDAISIIIIAILVFTVSKIGQALKYLVTKIKEKRNFLDTEH